MSSVRISKYMIRQMTDCGFLKKTKLEKFVCIKRYPFGPKIGTEILENSELSSDYFIEKNSILPEVLNPREYPEFYELIVDDSYLTIGFIYYGLSCGYKYEYEIIGVNGHSQVEIRWLDPIKKKSYRRMWVNTSDFLSKVKKQKLILCS